jgi:hypothetical protein
MSTLLRETQPAQNRIAGYLPQHADENGNYVATGDNAPMPVKVQFVKGMVPVQFQETLRTQLPIVTHASVIIGANAQNVSGWLDVRGYDKIAVNATMTSGTGMTIKIETSFDNSTYFSEKTLYDGSANAYVDTVDVPAPFIRLLVKNKDATNPKTTNASVFAKS